MSGEERKDREELGFRELEMLYGKLLGSRIETFAQKCYHLVTERIQEANSVNLQDGVYSPRCRLKVLEHMVGKKLYDIDQRIGRCDTVLDSIIPQSRQ